MATWSVVQELTLHAMNLTPFRSSIDLSGAGEARAAHQGRAEGASADPGSRENRRGTVMVRLELAEGLLDCKGRRFCSSCGGRRTASCAARLVDEVLPRVSVRQ